LLRLTLPKRAPTLPVVSPVIPVNPVVYPVKSSVKSPAKVSVFIPRFFGAIGLVPSLVKWNDPEV